MLKSCSQDKTFIRFTGSNGVNFVLVGNVKTLAKLSISSAYFEEAKARRGRNRQVGPCLIKSNIITLPTCFAKIHSSRDSWEVNSTDKHDLGSRYKLTK